MATWDNFIEKEGGNWSQGSSISIRSETPCSEAFCNSSQPTACLLSTLTSAVCSQHSVDLEKLQVDLKNMQTEMKTFQQNVMKTLQKLEETLSYLMDMVNQLDARSHDMEQRLSEEEERGAARSKVLAFLLPRERQLREKSLLLEKMLSVRNTWLEEVVQKFRVKE